jgi:integrase
MSALPGAAASFPARPALAHDQAGRIDAEYSGDHWNAQRLGVPALRGRQAARFDAITQGWLRDAVKRWSRFRLATGCAFATISAGALALSRFSAFLGERHPGIAGEAGITRAVLEDYLSWLLAQGYSASTRALSLSMLRVFSDACHRHGWLPGLPHGTVIYAEELPFHHDQVARFIPEFVMAQLESAAALGRLPFATTRNLVVVLIETGLRGGDACGLAFSPTLDDSAGWPCLRFEAAKVRAEQLIPLSAKAAAAIRSQQEHVRLQRPSGSPWLFPGITGNEDGSKPYSHRTFAQQLARWQRAIGLRDQAGQPVTVTGHQFRHTLGTQFQQRRPPARRAEAARPRQPAHDSAPRPPTPPSARHSTATSASGSTSPARPSATTRTRPPRPPRPPNGSSTTCPGSGTACPTATAAGRPSKTAPTPTPASPAPTSRPHLNSSTSTAASPSPTCA